MTTGTIPARPTWTYAYVIEPPHDAEQLQVLEALLEEERVQAQTAARMWAGRLVTEEKVTHIMIVTDSPDQVGDTNRRIEAALATLQAKFSMTAPMSAT